jgi:hypothetical protein
VSFNYDLILESSLQKVSAEWQPETGYGFGIPFYVTEDLPQTEVEAGTLNYVRAEPSIGGRTAESITVLKPHGSLNWLVPYEAPYVHTQQGVKFLDSPPILPLTIERSIRYWCSRHNFQYVALPNEMPSEVGICILPPSSAKRSELSFVKASRRAEATALAEADEAFVIGWSVPETDIDQADLIERAVGDRRTPFWSVTVVNWNAPTTYFDRIARLFQVDSGRLNVYNSGFVDFAARL